MLNDINLQTLNKDTVDGILAQTKNIFGENTPYKLYSTALDKDTKLVVFSNHFIDTMRLVLSEPDGGSIVQMGKEEQVVYFAFVDYQDETYTTGIDLELDLVMETLDICIADELLTKTATYVARCFDSAHDWTSYETDYVLPENSITLTQTEYDALLPLTKTMYVIVDTGVVQKIMIGTIEVWTLA